MSDLISALADQIVALINASPRSPTKAQIEEMLRSAALEPTQPIGIAVTPKLLKVLQAALPPGAIYRLPPGDTLDEYRSVVIPARPFIGSLPREADEKTRINYAQSMLETAREHPEIFDQTKVAQYVRDLGVCAGYASGHHHWEIDPFSTRETKPDEIANRCVCGATKEDEGYRAEAEKASQALVDAMNTTVYGGPTVEDREKFWANKLNEPSSFMTEGSPGTEGDAAAGGLSSIMPLPYKDVSVEMMQLLDWQEKCTKAWAPCPVHGPGGAHFWEEQRPVHPKGSNHNDVNLPPPPLRCACGAVKP